jgi:3-oxoacyl-[acyl-carrier-protein] synthase II
VVIGATDPPPHATLVSAFYAARVISADGKVSIPFTGMRGTHISGGACVWIVGDLEYCKSLGFNPIGAEILGVGTSSDADHIITPSKEGPLSAIDLAVKAAGVTTQQIELWDCHATATPGDWMEVNNIREIISPDTLLVARKGQWGHGMSVSGGWELTSLLMSVAEGRAFATRLTEEATHLDIKALNQRMVYDKDVILTSTNKVCGKINMGIGGINTAVIVKKYDS